ncbi:MAG: FtsX-like permease family protein, partial [Actinomycetota bacterium]
MSLFRLLHLRKFLEHRTRTALSIIGVSIGSSLMVAVLGLFGSLDGSVQRFVDDIAGGADLEVSAVSDEGFDERIFFDVEGVVGVQAAIPAVRSRVLIGKRQVILLGVDERAQVLKTRFSAAGLPGPPEADPSGLYIGEGLAQQIQVTRGATVDVVSSGGTIKMKIAAIVDGEAGRFNEGRFAVAALPVAQRALNRPGKIDSIFIAAGKGVDIGPLSRALQKVAGSTVFVDSPAVRVRQAKTTTRTMRYGLLMGVAMALVVGGFGVFNTMNMAALERRRELATMRALGGNRRQLLRLFLGEGALVGLVGSAVGALVGIAISKRLVESIPAFFSSAVGVELGFHLPKHAVPISVTAGTLVSLLAAYLPCRRAVRVAPVESMKPEGAILMDGSVRFLALAVVFGTGMMVGGFALAVRGGAGVGYMGLATLMLGAIIVSYGLMNVLASSTAWVARRFGVAGRLASAAIERAPRRAWAASVAVVASVGMVVAQTAITRNLNASLNDSYSSLGIIDLYVSADDATSFGADVLLPNEWRADLK